MRGLLAFSGIGRWKFARDFDADCPSYGHSAIAALPITPQQALTDWDGDWTASAARFTGASTSTAWYRRRRFLPPRLLLRVGVVKATGAMPHCLDTG